MKRILAFFFVLLYAISLLRPVSPLVEYVINYQSISTELCENLDKPELECNGKCHLSKQFKKQKESSEQQSFRLKIKWQDYPVGFVNCLKQVNNNFYYYFLERVFPLEMVLTKGVKSPIDYPPRIVS